ncbi:MAG: cysteine--tRNA ligase [Syntrophomonadaceae bacterium]|nr:cysteine--tRNA ligase [Syntrophomonadaceae bacterium]
MDPQEVKIYVCGPTTYNYIHIGNARPIVVFDTLRRYLEFKGYRVKYIQNFTDVDDKIIKRAQEENQNPVYLAERYINEYFKDAEALNVRRADHHPRVSEHIPEIIQAIETLINKGFAYQVGGDVFYRVRAFANYGRLSNRTMEDMLSGARVEIDERKEEPVDFALWKAAKPNEPFWDSPWGQGRPGWHIECSVMATKYLGDTIDIHGGGNDLVFPHHENEIAQAEAITDKPFVRYWMHNGYITVNNEKMSKSLGNFFILRDVLQKYPADVVRYYLITTHYRSPLDFDDQKLDEAQKALGRLKTTIDLLDHYLKGFKENQVTKPDYEERQKVFLIKVKEKENTFIQAMDDDLNTAKAIGCLFELSHLVNTFISQDKDQLSQLAALKAGDIFKNLAGILGLLIEPKDIPDIVVKDLVELLVELRQIARSEKDFKTADRLRNLLSEMAIIIEDTPSGSRIKYGTIPEVSLLMNHIINARNFYIENNNLSRADFIRDRLDNQGFVLEDIGKGAGWRFAGE